jgi:hypothetical protein
MSWGKCESGFYATEALKTPQGRMQHQKSLEITLNYLS